MKKTVYISHPYGGKEENIEDIKDTIRKLYTQTDFKDNFIAISPVQMFGFMYYDVSYEDGLQFTLDALEICDFVMLCGTASDIEGSTGCKREVEFATKHNIPIIRCSGSVVDAYNTLVEYNSKYN